MLSTRLARDWMNPDYERVYHYHIRKTAGTSLNAAFWALAGLDLREISDRSEVEGNGLKLVRGNVELIEKGDYLFANSHQPAYRLRLPPATFTVTILRDPVSRVISYYRYLLWARSDSAAGEEEPFIGEVLAESAFLDGARSPLARLRRRPPGREVSFGEFLERVPPHRLLTQLHMFSERLDPAEAAERTMACSAVCFTETFAADLKRLALRLQLDLEEKRERSFGEEVELADDELALLHERLAPEQAMIDRVRAGLASRAEPV
jgi:Sulfotransferase family